MKTACSPTERDLLRCRSKVILMDAQKVDLFIMTNQKYFPAEKIVYIKEKLLALDESKTTLVQSIDLKDPTTMFLFSFFLGSFGVDRFMMGDTGLGVLKLLTLGVCGIMTIVDWCTIFKRTREKNFNTLMTMI